MEEERDGTKELEELFGESDGGKWMGGSRGKRGSRKNGDGGGGRLRQPQHSGDEIFERKVEMLRQIPTEERRLLRRLQRNVQKMLKTE